MEGKFESGEENGVKCQELLYIYYQAQKDEISIRRKMDEIIFINIILFFILVINQLDAQNFVLQ